MPTYTTLDHLPDLSSSVMANALVLNLRPYTPTLSGITWDNSAYSIATTMTVNSTFRWTGTAGATYDFFSTSYYDPTSIRVYDSLGNAIAIDTESVLDAAGTDSLYSFVAPYSGTYYVNAGWSQSVLSPLATVSLYENIDTATGPTTDDYKGDASTTATIAAGGSVTGRIETSGDNDWIGIALTAGRTYTFNLDGTASSGLPDPYLRVYNSSGIQLASDDDSGQGLNSQLTFSPTATGTYYLSASSSPFSLSGVTGSYTLTASTGTVVLTDDYAGNSSTTGTVAIGGLTTGNIETAGDHDWFRVSLLAGTTYTFDLRGLQGNGGTLGTGTLHSPYLSLYDSLGLYRSAAYTNGTGGDPLLTFTPTSSGTYYLGVDELFGTGTGTYTLRASASTLTDDYAGSAATTGTVAIGGQITGNIERAGDHDWLRVSLLQGTTYTFDLRGADGNGGTLGNGFAEAYLTVYDASGLYRTATANGGTGGDPLITFSPSSSGTYYLDVSELFGTGTGTYTLRASALTVTDDYSANMLTQGRLTVGGQTTGNIETAGDNDWFGVSLQAGTTYTFELRGADGSGGTLGNGFAEAYLSLYDTSGLYRTATANGGTGGDPLLSFTPSTTGTYFLGVQELFGTGTGTYTLRASVSTVSTDDYKNDTTTTGTLVPGTSVTGAIETGGDADWFGITLTAGTSYTINLDAAASAGLTDPYLSLYNSTGALITSDDDSGTGLNAQLNYTPSITGRYFLGASSASFFSTQTGRYTLSVNNGTTIVDDYAANTLTTGTIAPGSSVSGKIETVNDNDWFSVRLTAGTTYTIHLDSASTTALSDPYLRLYDSAGALLRYDDDSGTGLNSQLTYTASTTGTYYLGASASGIYGTATGNYTLSVAPVAVTADDYAATTATTGRVTVGTTTSGQIESTGDHDWFSVTLTAGTRYTINLDSASNTGLYDPYLRLYHSSGTQLASDDDSGTGLNSEITYTPTTSGTYYIDASSASFFSASTGNYNLTVNATAPVVDDYMAGTATTGRATAGGKVTGKIETSGDHDWFSITLTAGNTYTINLDASASTGLSDPYVRLRNSAGVQVAYDDDSGVGLNSQLTYSPTTTDTYYIDASSSNLFSSLTGNYELSVSSAASVPAPVSTPGFNIDVRYSGDPQYQAAFTHAATRWQSIITSDLPDVTNSVYGLIDDLLITASVVSIDGPNGVLGRASPTAIRSGSGLPYLGMMQFDSADMASMLANGTLEGVILHEMGHVLGIGGLWDNNDLVDPLNDTHYTGQYALSAWRTVSGNANASYVPLETAGGLGTAGVHWSETTFGDELMTGYVDNHMPISIVTIGTLADLGYTVNYTQADSYALA
jgi:predicted secreted protein